MGRGQSRLSRGEARLTRVPEASGVGSVFRLGAEDGSVDSAAHPVSPCEWDTQAPE